MFKNCILSICYITNWGYFAIVCWIAMIKTIIRSAMDRPVIDFYIQDCLKYSLKMPCKPITELYLKTLFEAVLIKKIKTDYPDKRKCIKIYIFF